MRYVPARLSRALAIQSLIATGLTLAHSLRARGGRRTALFAALGLGLPVIGEWSGVNLVRALRHRTQPQVAGVPLNAAFGWYNIGYATFAMVESLLAPAAGPARTRGLALVTGTALTATSLDLLFDQVGLDQGFWEWHSDGPYARDIAGVNGRHGIPLVNFAGWIVLTGTVTGCYLLLSGDTAAAAARPGAAGSIRAGRQAALLFLPYYLTALAWALPRRRFRYILYSALAPLVALRALRGPSRR